MMNTVIDRTSTQAKTFIKTKLFILFFAFGLLILSSPFAKAEQLRIATASNFLQTLKLLSKQFEKHSGHKVVLIPGSSGKHYAQIKHGAPFDIFFSADSERPMRLEAEGDGIKDTRFTYAYGQLILWSPQLKGQGAALLNNSIQHLAIANPRLAPYGKAAKQVLQNLNRWTELKPQLVQGENINQTFQFVASGNAQLGFIAYSQLIQKKQLGQSQNGSSWLVPHALYEPIEQQAIVISAKPVAREFVEYIKRPESQALIKQSGYSLKHAD